MTTEQSERDQAKDDLLIALARAVEHLLSKEMKPGSAALATVLAQARRNVENGRPLRDARADATHIDP